MHWTAPTEKGTHAATAGKVPWAAARRGSASTLIPPRFQDTLVAVRNEPFSASFSCASQKNQPCFQLMPTEADTCRTLITPKLQAAGWEDEPHSIAEQRSFTDGRIIVRGGKAERKKGKRADYLLRYTRDIPIAVVEAKSEDEEAATGLAAGQGLRRNPRTQVRLRHERQGDR